MEALREWIASSPLFVVGTLASLVASLGTSVGALPVLGVTHISAKTQDVLMSTAAGIMLAATAFSLIAPGLEEMKSTVDGALPAASLLGLSVLAGAGAVLLVHRHVPHLHFIKAPDTTADMVRLGRVWLFVVAITLHNFPEGLSVGVGFGGGHVDNGLALTTAIFVQNLPEGFVVAIALLGQGYGRWQAVSVAAATGMVEAVGGMVGAAAVATADAALPFGLGFAGGAMLFVISHEIIPETHRGGYETHATAGLMVGFVAMIVLASAFE